MARHKDNGRGRWGRSSDYICQFRVVDSPIHRLNAGLKVILGMLLSVSALIARDLWMLAVILALNLAYYFLARLRLADIWQDTRFLAVQMLIVVGLYALQSGLPTGLWLGIETSLRIVLFFLPGMVFLRTTGESQMMRGVGKVLPYRLAFVAFVSLRFVPFLGREIRDIAMAQRLRGANLAPSRLIDPRSWKDFIHCLMIPLTIRALKIADETALSAKARGFGLLPRRTYWDPFTGNRSNNASPE